MHRQVPKKKYTIIGNGKLAKHFIHYFDQLTIDYNCWNRRQELHHLKRKIKHSDHILLMISDDAIGTFVEKYPFLQNKSLIHFSGSLVLDNVIGCHPLMTFSQNLYDLSTYRQMPFICDHGINFKELFPQLPNTAHHVANQDRAYYHALCVIAGNFTQTLMKHTSHQMSEELKLPNDILFPYLLQNTKNFINNPEQAATGPIQRNDFTTVNKNLQALENNPLESIYQTFIDLTKHSYRLRRIENEY